jgi:hypothetical protein
LSNGAPAARRRPRVPPPDSRPDRVRGTGCPAASPVAQSIAQNTAPERPPRAGEVEQTQFRGGGTR